MCGADTTPSAAHTSFSTRRPRNQHSFRKFFGLDLHGVVLRLSEVMNRLRAPLFATVFVSVLLVGALAPSTAIASPFGPTPIVRSVVREQAHGEEEGPAGSARPVERILLWSVTGVGLGALGLTTLYLLKRRIGGFPSNPAWVAPITIMPSRTFADESTFSSVESEVHHSPGHH